MANVLIATLGEHPIVVSGMVNVLCNEGINLDRVEIVYPDEPNERWIGIGYEMLEEYLRKECHLDVEPVKLPFADANTEAHCIEFLQIVHARLACHGQAGNRVYLSLAGGRKHTSALIAMLTQFHMCIKGLYHLYDKEENNARKQFSVKRLQDMSKEECHRRFNANPERFELIELPFQPLAKAEALWKWFAQSQEESPPPITVSPADESFYGALFRGQTTSEKKLDVWLTQTAYDQYCDEFKSCPQEIERYFEEMQRPDWLSTEEHGRHHQVVDSNKNHLQEGTKKPLVHFSCKKARTAIRPFYYTQPHAIEEYLQGKVVQRVIVTRFSKHINNTDLDVELDEWVRKNVDIEPVHRVADLPDRQVDRSITLIAPLGESPMVITQAYALMKAQNIRVTSLRIVYPGEYEPARNGADLLQKVCKERNIDYHPHPVKDMEDLIADEDVELFISGLKQAIQEARKKDPDGEIALLISGGRKGMSALAFYVAQGEGITHVYHTTICDPDKGQEIEEQAKAIYERRNPNPAPFLFLDRQNLQDYALIRVPVVSLTS